MCRVSLNGLCPPAILVEKVFLTNVSYKSGEYFFYFSWTKNDKDFKISLFEEVNKNIGDDKLKAERQKRKQSKKKPASVSTSCPESKQGKKKKKGKK